MTIRIHSGCWKGTKILVPECPGLRPTPIKIRETLANWLRPLQPFTHILDLFAGTGILGLEICSLTNGKAKVTFVDTNKQLTNNLTHIAEKLNITQQVNIYRSDAIDFLGRADKVFDLILLDPPYRLQQLDTIAIKTNNMLEIAANTLIYLEHKLDQQLQIPDDWQLFKSTKASQVQADLYRKL